MGWDETSEDDFYCFLTFYKPSDESIMSVIISLANCLMFYNKHVKSAWFFVSLLIHLMSQMSVSVWQQSETLRFKFTVRCDEEKHQIFTCEKFERARVWQFCLKNELNTNESIIRTAGDSFPSNNRFSSLWSSNLIISRIKLIMYDRNYKNM